MKTPKLKEFPPRASVANLFPPPRQAPKYRQALKAVTMANIIGAIGLSAGIGLVLIPIAWILMSISAAIASILVGAVMLAAGIYLIRWSIKLIEENQ